MSIKNYIDIRRTIPKHPTRKWKTRSFVNRIVVHCTAATQQNPNMVARNHIKPGPQNHLSSKGAPGLAYHDFIDASGLVYHCNNYSDWTWHARSWNKTSVGVVIAYRGDNTPPPSVQLNALARHLVRLCLFLKLPPNKVYGHREAPWMSTIVGKGSVRYKKVCPGMQIDLDNLRDMVSRGLQKRLKDLGLYTGAIDGVFGPKSLAALGRFDPQGALESNPNMIQDV